MTLLMLFKVSGHSMEPLFKAGQLLLVSSLPYLFNEPKVGDVVIAKVTNLQTRFVGSNQRLLLKRIIKKEDKKFFVAGDNLNHSTDSRTFGPISKEQILGKVIG